MTTAHTLILGGQRSGKSRAAEQHAADWLAGAPGRQAVLIATAWPGDAEMCARIERHQHDRRERVPGLATREEPLALGAAIEAESALQRLVVVDCLTLWATQCRMPPPALVDAKDAGLDDPDAVERRWNAAEGALLQALERAAGPVLLVSNEIGLGLAPMGAELRAMVDALGRLHQRVAARCTRVVLMVAGCPLVVKDLR